jgi:ribosomal protein L9
MYLQNKYTRVYNNIVERAKSRTISGYTENHHIIPRSLGGTDTANNLVSLTAKEHYMCHLLLPKMLEGESKYKMLCAILRMAHSNQKQRVKVNSRVYERVKIEKAAMQSVMRKGERNPFYGKTHTPEVIEKIKAARAAQIKKQGTVMTKAARAKLRERIVCPHCGLEGQKSGMKRWHMDNCKYK